MNALANQCIDDAGIRERARIAQGIDFVGGNFS
jgi:hypothetical protein